MSILREVFHLTIQRHDHPSQLISGDIFDVAAKVASIRKISEVLISGGVMQINEDNPHGYLARPKLGEDDLVLIPEDSDAWKLLKWLVMV